MRGKYRCIATLNPVTERGGRLGGISRTRSAAYATVGVGGAGTDSVTTETAK